MIGLYLGRFQLFHLGHVDVLEQLERTDDIEAIVVAVGSTQYDWRRKSPEWPWANNPFSYEERREMIVRSLEGRLRKPWSLCGVPDTHEHDSWFRGLAAAAGDYDVLYSSDERERVFFEARGKQARPFERRYSYHAGSLRRRIADGVDPRPFVPEGTMAVLERLDVRARIGELYARDHAGGE